MPDTETVEIRNHPQGSILRVTQAELYSLVDAGLVFPDDEPNDRHLGFFEEDEEAIEAILREKRTVKCPGCGAENGMSEPNCHECSLALPPGGARKTGRTRTGGANKTARARKTR